MRINCITCKLYDSAWYSPLTRTGGKCTFEWNSVVINGRERDVEAWKNVKVYFKWGWNKSSFDSAVFHFDDFNYGRRSQPYFFLTIAIQLGFFS